MARLPTVQDFGTRPTPRSGRGVVPIKAGTGAAATTAALDNITNIASAYAEKFAEEDAKREAQDLVVEYKNGLRLLEYGDGTDANLGYLNLQGRNAIDAREKHLEAVDALDKSVREKIGSPRVGGLVGAALDNIRGTSLERAIKHFGRERVAANDASNAALATSIVDTAAEFGAEGNSPAVAGEANRLYNVVRDYALEKGLSKDAAIQKAEQAATLIHFNEITRLNAIDPELARDYFTRHKGQIDGAKYNDIEKLLKAGEVQKAAQELSDKISEERGTLTERERKVRERATTPAKRDAAMALVRSRYSSERASKDHEIAGRAQGLYVGISSGGAVGYEARQAAIDDIEDADLKAAVQKLSDAEETRRQAMEKAEDKLRFDTASEAAHNNQPLTPDLLKGLSPRERAYVEEVKAEAELTAADPDHKRIGDGGTTWLAYLTMAGDPEAFGSLTEQELRERFEMGVTKEQFENTIAPAWAAARRGVVAAEAKQPVTAQRSRSQIVEQALKAAGKHKNAKAVMGFNRLVDEWISDLEASKPKGQKATPEEIQTIVDRLMSDVEVKGRYWWWPDPDRKLFQTEEGETPFVEGVEQIPERDRKELEAALTNSFGRKPTDEEVIEVWNDFIQEKFGG